MDLPAVAFLLPTSQAPSIICYVTFLHITHPSAVLIMYHTSPPVLKVREKKKINHWAACRLILTRSVSAKGLFIKPPGVKADGFLQLLDIYCGSNRFDGFVARGNNIIPKPSNVIQGLEPIH